MPQMMGNKVSLNPAIFERPRNYAIAYGMGLTAEKVAQQWKVSREDQDAFAVESHQKACAAIAAGHFKAEISPYAVTRVHAARSATATVRITERLVEHDEGPRPDDSLPTGWPSCGRCSPRAAR
jgi:acetyl-CoA acyltransferase